MGLVLPEVSCRMAPITNVATKKRKQRASGLCERTSGHGRDPSSWLSAILTASNVQAADRLIWLVRWLPVDGLIKQKLHRGRAHVGVNSCGLNIHEA
jgi:hypothetical protein